MQSSLFAGRWGADESPDRCGGFDDGADVPQEESERFQYDGLPGLKEIHRRVTASHPSIRLRPLLLITVAPRVELLGIETVLDSVRVLRIGLSRAGVAR